MKKAFTFLKSFGVSAVLLCLASGALTSCGGHTHRYEKNIQTDASCGETGEFLYKCQCGDTYSEVIPKKEHVYGEWSVKIAPALSEEGKLNRVCANDGNHIDEMTLPCLNEKDYSFEETEKATDSTPGKGVYSFTVDGQTFSFEGIKAPIGHSYGNGAVTKEPTCTENGEKAYVCSECGHTYVEVLPLLGHSYGEWYNSIAPQCEKIGKDVRECSRCNSFESRDLAALGHSTVHYEQKAPTCDSAGCNEHDACSRCSFSTKLESAALGHVYGEYTVEVAPTRTTEGNLFAICARDNTHKDIVVLPKLSTTNGYLYEVIVPATDISDGKGRFAFVRNGNTYYFDVIITANETEFDPR